MKIKTIQWIVTALLLSLVIFPQQSCKKDKEEEPSPEPDVILSENTKIIDQVKWQNSFISIDSSTYTYTFNSNINSLDLQTGDIMVASAGEGLLRKIKSINVVGGQIEIQTEQATLVDVIEKGQIKMDTLLTISGIKSIEYYYEGIALDTADLKQTGDAKFNWDINAVLYDYDGNLNTTSDQVRLEGDFNCNWNLIVFIDIGIVQGLKEVKCGFESYENLDLQLVAGLEYSFSKNIDLLTVNFNPIVVMVGPLPIVFLPQFKIKAGVDGYANASITASLEQSMSFDAGIQYLKNQGWSNYKKFDKSFNFNPPQLNMNAGAEPYLKPELIIKIYGIAGPFVNLKLYGNLEANLLETPWWKLYGGLKMDAGAKASIQTIIGDVIFEYTISDLINYEILISQADTPPGEAPVTAFLGSPTNGTAPLAVNFTDQSANDPTGWQWNFGDGETSTQKNPSHTYNSAGTYTVKLTASNSFGSDIEEKIGYIIVSNDGSSPVAAFTGNPTNGTAPLTVNFTDQSSNSPTSWQWNFGDGSTSTQQNASHTYNSAGTYTVELEVSNGYGSDIEVKNNYITVTIDGTGEPCPGIPDITYEGQVYNTVLIGTQCWLKENLNVGSRINGSQNQNPTNGVIEKYCYNDLVSNCNIYGALYQWNEAMQGSTMEGSQGICPDGWHIPTNAEWSILSDYLGGDNIAGGKMKSTSGWYSNGNGTNTSGFTALPAGASDGNHIFSMLTYRTNFYSSSAYGSDEDYYVNMLYSDNNLNRLTGLRTSGLSIRCVKNE